MANIVHIFLGSLGYLQNTMYIESDAGSVSIDLTRDGQYSIEYDHFPGMRRMFKTKNQVVEFIGNVDKITMFDHEKNKEKVIY